MRRRNKVLSFEEFLASVVKLRSTANDEKWADAVQYTRKVCIQKFTINVVAQFDAAIAIAELEHVANKLV